jgi:prepilin-type N-terminal cleavage/methylation domain-containing protein/prepilin-type processing-associated H-X9-DG protein
MKKAFTLIELLVVIAIIAILAAILFPVFAQAKESAKSTQCLSNMKQTSLSLQMYANDYDDFTINQVVHTTTDASGNYVSGGYWFRNLQPYVKSWPLWLCPDRSTADPGYSATIDKAKSPMALGGRYLGYGYNDGFVSDSGYGLSSQLPDPSYPGKTYRPGRSQSVIVAPAATIGFGDTNDTPGYSVAMDNTFSGPDGPTSTSVIRHRGRQNFAFVDGHAKSVVMQAGNYTGAGGQFFVARPANQTLALGWCYDPNAGNDYSTFQSDTSGYPVESLTDTCQMTVADFYDPSHFTLVP